MCRSGHQAVYLLVGRLLVGVLLSGQHVAVNRVSSFVLACLCTAVYCWSQHASVFRRLCYSGISSVYLSGLHSLLFSNA